MAYYPEVGYYFRVEFDLPGNPIIYPNNDVRFQEVKGLTASLEEDTIIEGGENRFKHRIPGRAKYEDLTLSRGMLSNSGLIDWFREAIEDFKFTPIPMRVQLLTLQNADGTLPVQTPGTTPQPAATGASTGVPLVTWAFERAYPKSWSVTGLDASKSGILVEEIKIAYQRFRRV